MKPTDFPFAVELANTLDWDMADVDFEYMSALEPDGCFVLWEGCEQVGIATCIDYGRIGWFGNLAVKPEVRRKGAGTFLVERAVEYLRGRGVEAVGLYAYQHLVGFYRRIGFKPIDDFVVLNGTAQKPVSGKSGLTKATESDIALLTEFDIDCTGWNRRRLLESMLREEGILSYYSAADAEVRGFVMAKVYGEMAEIGPLLCRQDQKRLAIELVEAVLSEVGGLEVYAYVPVNEAALLELFFRAGLQEKFRVTRMFLGSAGAENCVYMPESLERG
jgi:GNAT superfamily N-acetyltransferase